MTDMPWHQVMGLIAACLTTAAFVPQALRVIRTKQTRDLSLATYLLFVIGILMWLAYGVIERDLPMIVANAVTLPLALAILVTKLRHG